MRLSRNSTLVIHYILDQLLPPVFRDSPIVMGFFLKLLFGKQTREVMDFKNKAFDRDEHEITEIYLRTAPYNIKRKTDINDRCLMETERSILGTSVLDIACGRGYLSGRLARKYSVTGADMIIEPGLRHRLPEVDFREVNLCSLPFRDKEFDTVVCAHTLEHIPNINLALTELRRVARQRLIVILPRQRPYKYTFDLHLHFFPYAWSVKSLVGKSGNRQDCTLINGDWMYVEDICHGRA